MPSTLHQVMKYADSQGQVHTLVAEQHPFKGVKTHFTDSLLYQEVNKTTTQGGVTAESGNETDDESESTAEAEDQEWELDLSVIGHDNLNYLLEHDSEEEEWYLEDIQASTTDDETGGWYINKNSNLDFLYEHASTPSPDNSVCGNGSPRSSLEALRPLHVPVVSSLITDRPVEDIRDAFFEVPPRRKNQKPLYFGRCRDSAWKYVSLEYETYTPEFSKYHPKAQLMMQR